MTEIWLKQCHICLVDFIPLKDFSFFACGHKWCSSCVKKHKGDPLCGECRQPKGKPHRIYLELEELVDDQIALVAGGLNAIDMESSASDIEEFNRTVRKLGQKFNANPDVLNVLLDAVKDLKERLPPLAQQCAGYKTLNEALNQQLKDLQAQNHISRDRYKKAKLSVESEKQETKRLRFAVERQRLAKEAVITEKKELQAKVEDRYKEIKLLNTKLKALSKTQKVKSTRSAEDPDASLQIEPSETNQGRHIPLRLKREAEDRTTRHTSVTDSSRRLKKART